MKMLKKIDVSETQEWFKVIEEKHKMICSMFGLKFSPSPGGLVEEMNEE